MTPKKFMPGDNHRTSLSKIVDEHLVVSLYGKTVENLSMEPTGLGMQHPSGSGSLHAGHVYGFQSQEKGCVRFSPPRLYMLPEPVGPADGCGWDPAEFVVWKVPLGWSTVHFQVRSGAISESLTAGAPGQLRLSAGQSLAIASDCIFAETGNPQTIDRSRTLQSYTVVDPEQLSGIRARIVNSSDLGVQRFGFQIDANDLKDMSSSWTLGQLSDRIQDGATPA